MRGFRNRRQIQRRSRRPEAARMKHQRSERLLRPLRSRILEGPQCPSRSDRGREERPPISTAHVVISSTRVRHRCRQFRLPRCRPLDRSCSFRHRPRRPGRGCDPCTLKPQPITFPPNRRPAGTTNRGSSQVCEVPPALQVDTEMTDRARRLRRRHHRARRCRGLSIRHDRAESDPCCAAAGSSRGHGSSRTPRVSRSLPAR